jgi:hypothetical protein
MFQRFTERARRVTAIAQDEARILGHAHVGSEHLLRPAPRRDGRWIYLEGWSQDDRFCLGGELLVDSAEAREARLALADGTELVDDLAGGVVLFLDDRSLQHPAIVRVYDGHGATLASHPAF